MSKSGSEPSSTDITFGGNSGRQSCYMVCLVQSPVPLTSLSAAAATEDAISAEPSTLINKPALGLCAAVGLPSWAQNCGLERVTTVLRRVEVTTLQNIAYTWARTRSVSARSILERRGSLALAFSISIAFHRASIVMLPLPGLPACRADSMQQHSALERMLFVACNMCYRSGSN